jgi:hypothetical protein
MNDQMPFRELAESIIDAAFMTPPQTYKVKRENRELMITILAGKIAEHLRGGLVQDGLSGRKLDPETIKGQMQL